MAKVAAVAQKTTHEKRLHYVEKARKKEGKKNGWEEQKIRRKGPVGR